jgi:hypothetical protein
MTFTWTPELTEYLCDEISSGKSIHEIANTHGLPSEPTIYREMARNSEFEKMVSKARAAQQDFEVDSCIRMADEAKAEDFQIVKLRIWARQWRASKLASKKYGDKIEHTGDKENPISHKIEAGEELAEIMTLQQLEKVKQRVLAKSNAG